MLCRTVNPAQRRRRDAGRHWRGGDRAPTSGLSAALLLPRIGACLTATACYGLAGFLTRRWIQQRGGLEAERVALGSQVGATLFLFPFFLWSCWHGPAVDWRQESAVDSDSHAGHGLHGGRVYSLLPLDCRYRAAAFAVGDLLIPPFAALWGYLCLGETVEEGLILGALLVCVALWMIIVPSGAKTRGTGRRMMHRRQIALEKRPHVTDAFAQHHRGCLQ